MTDLDPEIAKQFYLDHASAVAEDPRSQRSLRAHQDPVQAHGNGTVHSPGGKDVGGNGINGHDEVDVFGNADVDASGMASTDEGPVTAEVVKTEGHILGSVVSDTCGLSDIYPTSEYPDARIDAYLFSPCGFSANGVIPAPARGKTPATTYYFNVHVTPEAHCSYASFETNVPSLQVGRSTAEVVEDVVSIFQPGRFSVTLFEAKSSCTGGVAIMDSSHMDDVSAMATAKRSARMESIQGYRRMERIVHDLDGYDLVFRCYERDGWKGGAPPRLGEL